MASPNHLSSTEKVTVAATESLRAPDAAPIKRRNTPWPHEQQNLSKLAKLYAILKAVLSESARPPKLDISAIRAQIMCRLSDPSASHDMTDASRSQRSRRRYHGLCARRLVP
jgi:ElaB/YqjD/DUF883 family membrane-anchored ribosome-binding protein